MAKKQATGTEINQLPAQIWRTSPISQLPIRNPTPEAIRERSPLPDVLLLLTLFLSLAINSM